MKSESSRWLLDRYKVYTHGRCRRLTAAAICARLGVNLHAWRQRVLQKVHVEVVLALHRFLYAQLKDVGEIAGGVKPQIHYRISNAGREHRGGKHS